MKTIIRLEFEENQPASSYIRRVNDTDSVRLMKEGGWKYAPKSVWKEKIRDIKKEKDTSKKKSKKKEKA
jgi:hypothetical protein|tara:strand:- start:499 stop:705 length:207 start_codon:yes stop_codon:yes gene_type:complete